MPTRPPLGLEVALERSGRTWLDGEVSGYDGFDILVSVRPQAGCPTAEREPEPAPAIAEADVDADAWPDVPIAATLVWTTERGLFRAPVAAAPVGERWRVSFQAQADRTQRREYVRLPMDTPMTLSHELGTVRGTLVDVSEAALRARLDLHQTPMLRQGDSVRAAFTLHHTGFMLRGTVLREQRNDAAQVVEVVVMLDIPARTANDLRRNVVFEQVERQSDHRRERRRGLP